MQHHRPSGDSRIKPRISIALSGGGFRASIFHLGVMKRLAELNLLRYTDVLSTVSGGSIIGAFLALRFEQFLNAGSDGRAFEQIVATPFRELVEQHNLLLRWLEGAWRWPFRKLVDRTFSRTKAAGELLGDIFFKGASCNGLPDHPLLVLKRHVAAIDESLALYQGRTGRFTCWSRK